MQQRFIDKLLNLFITLVMIKFVLMLLTFNHFGVADFIRSVSILIFIGILVGLVLTFLKGIASQGETGATSSVIVEESLFDKLRKKYESHAEQYRQQGQYLKASGIYLRLLQNPHKAALGLQEGGLFNEAAVLYLKKLNDKESAAGCYEKGRNYKMAIELYKDLNKKEKMGDLYLLLNDRVAANNCYNSLIDDYTNTSQYVKASLIARQKMHNPERARTLLLQGWNNNTDAYNCINNYFASFSDTEELKKAINSIYKDTSHAKKEVLLTALKYEFKKGRELEEFTRNIAYEIIASHIQTKPSIAAEMKYFNPEDKMIINDIVRYKTAINRIVSRRN